MNSKHPKVDEFLANTSTWRETMVQLRAIALDCGLTEAYKWRQPCYTLNNANILLIGGFKDFCVLSFLKGALLQDADGILDKAGENTQSARIIRFTSPGQVVEMASTIKAYIFEAIEVEKAGLKVDYEQSRELVFPEELHTKMAAMPAFKTAFEALTPGRQRAYNLYFSAAKQSATRTTRIEKYTGRILNGKGINDCVCGLSKRMPNCDGSHNTIR